MRDVRARWGARLATGTGAACLGLLAVTGPADARPSDAPAAVAAPVKLPAAKLPAAKLPASTPVPFADTAVRYDAASRRLVVAASGLADGRGRLEAQRLRARKAAVARGRGRLVAYVDDRLASALASPALASRVHALAEGAAVVLDDRPLADGSMVVRLALPCAVLTRAWPDRNGWWAQ